MQKMICILLCTVFPLVTTLATLLRLWQSGMFVSPSTPSPPPSHITGKEEDLDIAASLIALCSYRLSLRLAPLQTHVSPPDPGGPELERGT